MAYGDLKVRNLIWNTGSGDNTVVLSTLATQTYVTTNFAPKSSPTFTGTINGADLILSGNLTVNGTQTIINTQTLDVEDKQIEIGKVSSPSDTTADQGGLKLKGASDKTFLWVNATVAWTSSEHIHVPDNKRFMVGTGRDLQIFNDGSTNQIHDANSQGVRIRTSDFKVMNEANNEAMLYANQNGAVQAYHDNQLRFSTSAGGIVVTGSIDANDTISSGNANIKIDGDTGKFLAGASNDLQLYHSSSNSYLTNSTGYLFVQSDNFSVGTKTTGENIIVANVNDGVDLFFNGTKRAETTNTGFTVTGTLTATAFTGDGSGLSGLPASAGEYTATAANTLTAGQVVFLDSSGNLKKPTKTINGVTPSTPTVGLIDSGRTTWDPRAAWDSVNKIGIVWRPSSSNNNGSGSLFYMSVFTVDTETNVNINSSNHQPSSANSEKRMVMIPFSQPSSNVTRFVAIWKRTDNYSVAQCFDADKTNGNISAVGSQCQVGWIGAGYRVYSDPHGICKCATANRFVVSMYNASAAAGGIDLIDVNPSTGAITRNGNGLQLSASYGQANDRNMNIVYDPNVDRILVHWSHEDSPYYQNYNVVRVNGSSLSIVGSGNFGGYFTRSTTTYDPTLNKICIVAGDNTNNRQVAVIGSLQSSGFSYTTTEIYNSNNYSGEISGTIEASSGRFVMSYGDGTYAKIKSAPISGNNIGTFTSTFNLPVQWWSRYAGHGGWLQLPHISRTLWLGYQYPSGYQYRRSMMYVIKASEVSSDLTPTNYLGIAKTTGSGTRTINTIGAINTNVSGLTTGATYYAQADGTLATSADGITGSIPVGMALASNKLLLKH